MDASRVRRGIARAVAVAMIVLAAAIVLVPTSSATGSCGNLLSGSSEGWCDLKNVGWFFVVPLALVALLILWSDARWRQGRREAAAPSAGVGG